MSEVEKKCPNCGKMVKELIEDKYWSDEPICKECMYWRTHPMEV